MASNPALLCGGWSTQDLLDPEWARHPRRFYRARGSSGIEIYLQGQAGDTYVIESTTDEAGGWWRTRGWVELTTATAVWVDPVTTGLRPVYRVPATARLGIGCMIRIRPCPPWALLFRSSIWRKSTSWACARPPSRTSGCAVERSARCKGTSSGPRPIIGSRTPRRSTLPATETGGRTGPAGLPRAQRTSALDGPGRVRHDPGNHPVLPAAETRLACSTRVNSDSTRTRRMGVHTMPPVQEPITKPSWE